MFSCREVKVGFFVRKTDHFEATKIWIWGEIIKRNWLSLNSQYLVKTVVQTLMMS